MTYYKGMTPADRLTMQSEVMPTGCIEWRGFINPKGYGRARLGGVKTTVHRVAFMVHVGPIPEGFEIDHLCRNRCCINPAHLEAVSHAENTLRSDNVVGVNARKTHCHRGHEFSPENTVRLSGNRRECRTCRNTRYRQPQGGAR